MFVLNPLHSCYISYIIRIGDAKLDGYFIHTLAQDARRDMTFRVPYLDVKFKDYLITADKTKLDLEYLYNLLCVPSRYSTGLPPERFPLVIQHSLCFSVYHDN